MYECKKCGKVKAEPKEIVRIITDKLGFKNE